ncbi:MAG: RHS repeat-associated core domain-containing protein [Xanthomonadaceae bacterium]|nr:RHS repeat-associated core domain-containing protein [Xanthomonadaceae bacterium]
MLSFLSRGISAFALLSLTIAAHAQTTPTVEPYQEYGKKVKASERATPLTDQLFGEEVSLYNGATSFSVVDIDIPGNSALPVRLGRTFSISPSIHGENLGGFGNWDVDVPMIEGTFTEQYGWVASNNTHQRCSNPSEPFTGNFVNSVLPEDVWHGNRMHLPGQGSKLLFVDNQAKVPAVDDGQTYRWITQGFNRIRCISSLKNGHPGEGFLAITPEGQRYYFDWMIVRKASTVKKPWLNGASAIATRKHYYLMATRVEDRFGNYVNYTYSGDKLTRIESNDGRWIDLAYSGSDVSSASSSQGTWSYTYATAQWRELGGAHSSYMTSATNPDGSKWAYSIEHQLVSGYYPILTGVPPTGGMPPASCPDTPETAGQFNFSIVHPSGAQGKFQFHQKMHHRTHTLAGVTWFATSPTTGYCTESIPSYFDNFALVQKTISGTAIGSLVWNYDYGWVKPFGNKCLDAACTALSQQAPYCPTGAECPDTPGTKYVTIVEPDGTKQRYRYGVQYNRNEGRLISSSVVEGSTVKSETWHTYYTPTSSDLFPIHIGEYPSVNTFDPMATLMIPTLSTRTIRDGVEYTTSHSGFDAFARPSSTTESNTLGYSRTQATEYFDQRALWVLSQTLRQSTPNSSPNGTPTSNWMTLSETEYNALAQPWKTYRFGKLQQTLTYNTDGTLATATDGRGNTISLSNWKRGIPQLIQHPATAEAPSGATESATVNDNGWITSVTDEVGSVTGYGYDAMGRLASIIQPTGDAVAAPSNGGNYYNTIRNFRALDTADWKPAGILNGQWRLYEETGNRATVTYMDAMWRPILTHEYDIQNPGTTLRASKTTYDNSGRVSFQSYPSSDTIPGDTGTRTLYDALDRVTRVEQDSEHGELATTTEYQAGLKTRITNPRGFSTTTSFMAWGQPTYDYPIRSEQPEDKVIEISRHPQLGWPLQLTQRNTANTLSATRRYVYDGNVQLCKTIEPETGVAVMGYDGAGNLAWQASGLDGASAAFNSTTDCQHAAAYGGGRTTTRTYDARNRLTHLNFPNGGQGNQIWTYKKDGLPESVTTYNDVNNATPVVTTYTYNNRRLLVGETLAQPGWYSWSVGYAYDGYGHLSTQTYPTGLVVDYAPNPLGQPTKAGTYASGAQYYPNGALKQFTYGNGIVHTMQQNARQLPSRVTSSGEVNDFTYNYDNNGNVTNIWDLARGDNYSRWLSYDNLDRLTAAGSASFGGDAWHRMTYDALDNLKSWKLAGVKDYAEYVYDAQSHRLTSIRNTAGATVVGFAYDPQGNLQNKNGQGYVFDYGNRLRSATLQETYRYDGLGRRVQTNSANGKTTLWLYTQSGQMLFSSDWGDPASPAQQTHEHVYLAGSMVAIIDHAWPSNAVLATKYQHTDALGSPVAVTNESAQAIERMDYEPWGAIIGKPNHNGIGYTGHVMDGATGLTYMQQRYYDQSIGRFLSVDPVTANSGTGANFNRYWYANNNSYRFVDPDGRLSINCAGSLCDGYRQQGGRACELTCMGEKSSWGSGFDLRRHKTPQSQEKLIRSVGGNVKFLRYARSSHENFVTGGLGLLGTGGLSSVGGPGTVTLYRAVTQAEASSIAATGRFSMGPNSLGGKFFAETLEHAKKWGDSMNGPGVSQIIQVKLPKQIADQLMRWERLDGIGPARYAELHQLEQAAIKVMP